MKLSRSIKRSIIIVVYFILFFLIGYGIYAILKPAETCLDGKKNQNESDVDCGGVCKACQEKPELKELVVEEKAFVFGGEGKYDVMMKIKNPNDRFGAEKFKFYFQLKDASGKIIAERLGEKFILPSEEKYVVEVGLETAEDPALAEVAISDYAWKEFSEYVEEPQVNIFQKKYDLVSGGVGFSKLSALVRNESYYDFNVIKINVILRDGNKMPVALNSTEMRTVHSGEERDFVLIWPASFPGDVDVDKIDIEAEADVFDNQNFIKTFYQDTKQFQKSGS